MRALLTLGLDELNELPGHAHCLFVATRVVRSSDEPLRATPEPDLREGGVHRADKAVYVPVLATEPYHGANLLKPRLTFAARYPVPHLSPYGPPLAASFGANGYVAARYLRFFGHARLLSTCVYIGYYITLRLAFKIADPWGNYPLGGDILSLSERPAEKNAPKAASAVKRCKTLSHPLSGRSPPLSPKPTPPVIMPTKNSPP